MIIPKPELRSTKLRNLLVRPVCFILLMFHDCFVCKYYWAITYVKTKNQSRRSSGNSKCTLGISVNTVELTCNSITYNT